MISATPEISTIQIASTLEEVEEIQKFRYQVYAKEMELDLPGADHSRQRLVDPLDVPAIHLYARAGSILTGAVRLNVNSVPQGLDVSLQTASLPRPFIYCSRLYVLEQWRGTGVMKELAQASFQNFYEHDAGAAICHCYPYLFKLYFRLGFRPYGTPFLVTGLERLGPQTPLRCLLVKRSASLAA